MHSSNVYGSNPQVPQSSVGAPLNMDNAQLAAQDLTLSKVLEDFYNTKK